MVDMTEKERQNQEELLKLICDNPDLPIVPMVDAEIVGGDYGQYLGSWGPARVDEYIITFDGRVCFKSDDDVFDTLEHCMNEYEFNCLPESEEVCRPYYNELPWTKAIVVDISQPE